MAIGNNVPGQYIIGTFAADSSRSQSIIMSPGIMLNLVQVRDITVKPDVTWRTPVKISGPSDVNTEGTYFGSWAPQDADANNFPVSGVTFQGFSDLPFHTVGPTFDAGYDSYGSPGTSDSNYNTLLKYGRYSSAGDQRATFSWSGMTPEHRYLIQLWVNDGRDIGESRSETITGGTTTSPALNFGSDGSGPGQYIIGTFVANSSGGQTLFLDAFSSGSNPSPQINLFQIRDITPIISNFAVTGPTLTLAAANGPANAPFVLLQSASMTVPLTQWTPVLTNAFDGNGSVNLSTNIVDPTSPNNSSPCGYRSNSQPPILVKNLAFLLSLAAWIYRRRLCWTERHASPPVNPSSGATPGSPTRMKPISRASCSSAIPLPVTTTPKWKSGSRERHSLPDLQPPGFVADPMLLKEVALVLDDTRFDVIVFNNGMHGWQHNEAEYRKALPKLIKTIRAKAPKTRLLWATTTPLRDGKGVTYDTKAEYSNERIAARNSLAAEIVAEQKIPTVDLNAAVRGHPDIP